MADWDEIKRLAADFQRTQASDTLQRLSERNCIDIVKKLTDLNLIDLIYTCDGKEFITPAHLVKEIEDEVFVSGGRMHLHELASKLNVDYQHVENRAKDLVRDQPDKYNLILGQVIHSTYKATLGKQIRDHLLNTGELRVADFAKSQDLPSEFLLSIIKDLLPQDEFVVGHDEQTYYTTDMMDRYKSIVAGTLSAIIQPATIASIMKRLDMPERVLLPIVEGLIKEGRVDATVENRLYIPAIYARKQNEWINTFYSANSYIEYDVLSRMDIKQPKTFLKKRFPESIQLKTCIVSPDLLSQVESLVEDCIASNGWIDISGIVTSAIESDDIGLLLQELFKKNKQFSASCLVFNQVNVCSLGYLANCKNSLSKLMQSKAQEHLEQGKLLDHFLGGKLPNKKPTAKENEEKEDEVATKTEENVPSVEEKAAPTVLEEKSITEENSEKPVNRGNKKGGGGGGGNSGGQGREIKQKAVKKKYIPGNKGNQKNNDNSDEESAPTKAPKSSRGRAARRGISPERGSGEFVKKVKGQPVHKEPLVFLTPQEIMMKLNTARDCSEEFLESVAEAIQDELNTSYETVAKQTLDVYLESLQSETKVE